MRRQLNVLALIKGEETYVFVFADECQQELIDSVRQWAADPNLSLSWFDAAVLTERARQQIAANEVQDYLEQSSRLAEI